MNQLIRNKIQKKQALLALFVVAALVISGLIISEQIKKNNRKLAVLRAVSVLTNSKPTVAQAKITLAQMQAEIRSNRPVIDFSRGKAVDEFCANVEELWGDVDEDTPLSSEDWDDLLDDLAEYYANDCI
ncbi:MAG: hypothetical protein HY397_02865 [Candidatus Doudnabacteria bacterium]|nr:hypothetical protein [Candidatus Doudnabacteria bacterium]